MPVCGSQVYAPGWLTEDNDWAASIVADHVGASKEAQVLRTRVKSYQNIWNAETGFMEARNSDGTWAGPKTGWTEGDHWAYSLTVMVRRF
jgi:putative alpha-1,2-mannosidase